MQRYMGVSRHIPAEDSAEYEASEGTFPMKTRGIAKIYGQMQTLPAKTRGVAWTSANTS